MPADYSKEKDPYLDLTEEESIEALGDQVQKAKAELEKLKQQQEAIEREKGRLEELKRRQEELENGRNEMADKLTRSIVVVQREAEEAQKRLEQLHAIHNSFTEHLRYIETINPKAWGSAELPRELSKAISAVEDARADYVKAQAKISVDLPESPAAASGSSYEQEYGAADEHDFLYWLKSGLAFTLPLLLVGLIGLLLWSWELFSHQH
jgi:DNA repair exonuclease SbcCD ATPase subunit